MNAKEYLEKNHPYYLNSKTPSILEEYHQLKSKEEAEERYEAAIRLFAEEYLEEGLNIKDFPQTIKAMYLAAFGKGEK